MRRLSKLTTLLTTVFVTVAGQGVAQDNTPGAEEFAQRCAICHGLGGTGDGDVGELFETQPKDLRLLAKANDGLYPAFDVFQAINGDREILSHGTNMPIWGDYFMVESLEDRNINPKDARSIVDGRIITLVYYIHTLQVR